MLDASRFFSLKNPNASKPMVGIETSGGNTLVIVNTPEELFSFSAQQIFPVDDDTIDAAFPGNTLTGGSYQFFGVLANSNLYYANSLL